jgi:hypothetical protein
MRKERAFDEVEALAPDRADDSFAVSVRLRCPRWSFERLNAEAEQEFLVETGGEHGPSIVDQVSVSLVARQELSRLLERQLVAATAHTLALTIRPITFSRLRRPQRMWVVSLTSGALRCDSSSSKLPLHVRASLRPPSLPGQAPVLGVTTMKSATTRTISMNDTT